MQVLETNFFTKSNNALNSVVKNTSCSHGWLRLVVQIVFGAITVGSFIMIMSMAMQRPTSPSSRGCEVRSCWVICSEVHLDEDEEDVTSTAMEAGIKCESIALTLRGTIFTNGTMPMYWMSRMPKSVHILNIIGGNLHHIPPSAFVGQFAGNLRSIWLEDITITQWISTTFVGLSSISHLHIKNCVFGNIARNALRAIDSTIKTITVTHSGKWDPEAITGNKYSNNRLLDTVDFSFNDFGSIITGSTFEGLKYCKSLYLNSCKITALGVGAFDPLDNIELLFLSNNYLHTVPPGLFKTFLKPNHIKPRIHLQDNPWKCECSQKDIIELSEHGLLPVDALCDRPSDMNGISVRELEKHCNNSIAQIGMDIVVLQETNPVPSQDSFTYLDQPCFHGQEMRSSGGLKLVSPLAHFQCSNISSIIKSFIKISEAPPPSIDLVNSNWIRPTLILKQSNFSMIQVSSRVSDHGLLWYQSSCPNEVYCINIVPNFLRLYDSFVDTEYIFCPFDLKRYEIRVSNCVGYNFSTPSDTENIYYKYLRSPPFLYIGISLVCLVFGATCVYMIIRKNPMLLKGSKRLLFVKHRNVDALVLPPKIPLRKGNSWLESNASMSEKIFTLPDDSKLSVNHFIRSNSVRSDKSSTPTYVSAMQPTEAQLAEWRIRHHFDKSPSIISISSDISTISWTTDCTSAEITTNVVYESMK